MTTDLNLEHRAMQFKVLTGVAVVDASAIDAAGYASQLSLGGYPDREIVEILAHLAYKWDEVMVRNLTPGGRSNPFRQEWLQRRPAGKEAA